MSLYDQYLKEKKDKQSLYSQYKKEKYLARPEVQAKLKEADIAKQKAQEMSSPLGIAKGTIGEIPQVVKDVGSAIGQKIGQGISGIKDIFSEAGQFIEKAKQETPQLLQKGTQDVISNIPLNINKAISDLENAIKNPKTLKDIKPIGEIPATKFITKEAPREIAIPAVKGYLGKPIYNKLVGNVVPENLATPKGNILPKISQVAGQITAFENLSSVTGNLLGKSEIGRQLIKNSPKLSKVLQTTASGLSLDQLHTDKVGKERVKLFASGIPKWIGFGIAGQIAPKNIGAWSSTTFATQYASSKLEGKTNEEAFKDALNMTAIMGVFKIAEGSLAKSPEQLLREKSFKELELKESSTPREIKKKYYELSRKYHPDRPNGNEAKFKKVKVAYDVLSSKNIVKDKSLWQEIKDIYNKQNVEPTKLLGEGTKPVVQEVKSEVKPVVKQVESKPTKPEIPIILGGKVEKPITKVQTEISPEAKKGTPQAITEKKGINNQPIEKITQGTAKKQSLEELKQPIKIKPKIVEVPQSQLPVGEGKIKVSRLEARIKGVTQNVSQDIIDNLGLSTYKAVINPENVKKASEYVVKNTNEAIKVLQGEIEEPKGILRNSIFVAMQNNIDLPYDLATKLSSLSSTRYGQELSVLQEINPDSPVRIMKDVYDIKAKTFKKLNKNVNIEKLKRKYISKGRKNIKAPSGSDWKALIEKIKC